MSNIVNRNITFINSNELYKGSLDTLASNLDDKDFKYSISEFSPDKLEILKRKDPYPYEWVDSYEIFNYPQFPPEGCFYSSLGNGNKYLHLQNVWDTFNFNKFADFDNLCLKEYVLLLADVFEKLISTSLKYYNIDPCH